MHDLQWQCTYLKLRVCGRKLRINCCSILESTGSGPHDSNAFSKLSSGEIACYNEAGDGQIERMSTHSNALSSPSTLPRRLVNLHINAYTNSDSHLSDGYFAFEGGQMCPFLSTCCAAAMLQPNGGEGCGQELSRSCEPLIRATYIHSSTPNSSQ